MAEKSFMTVEEVATELRVSKSKAYQVVRELNTELQRQVIDLVGRDKMQEELKNLQYGNCDILEWNGSNINPLEKLNGFWLDSSLKISPLEQVEVLSRIFEKHSDYDSRNIEILKRIMLVDENDSQKIYGKTGSGNGEAWFVGFSESSGERRYIAIYLNDSEHRDQVSGNKAKEIVLDILQDGF
jgi:bla regulator protein BlaR1